MQDNTKDMGSETSNTESVPVDDLPECNGCGRRDGWGEMERLGNGKYGCECGWRPRISVDEEIQEVLG